MIVGLGAVLQLGFGIAFIELPGFRIEESLSCKHREGFRKPFILSTGPPNNSHSPTDLPLQQLVARFVQSLQDKKAQHSYLMCEAQELTWG